MYTIKPVKKLKTEIELPADKSISHRAAIISAVACGKTVINPYLLSDDTLITLECLKRLKVKAVLKGGALTVKGNGLYFSAGSKVKLNAWESGTTLRILSGLLVGQKFSTLFEAAPSLMRRPMGRVTQPLRLMGADIRGKKLPCPLGKEGDEEYVPLVINPVDSLRGIHYTLSLPSAQVKSAILLASFYINERTHIIEPVLSRDHTERMLVLFKGALRRKGGTIIFSPPAKLISPGRIFVPCDFSSASFFIVLALIADKARITMRNVNINPTRCGLLRVLKRMGADIKISKRHNYFEPYADICVKSSFLLATEVRKEEIPLMIDEIPILCAAAAFARGTTRIWGLRELKVKETDRINALVNNLKSAGVGINARRYKKGVEHDWVIEISGGGKFKPGNFKSFSDHRTAMSMIVFALALKEESTIDDIQCINKSFPQFISLIERISQ